MISVEGDFVRTCCMGEGEFGIKRGNIGVLARFGLFLAGIAMLFETKGKKGNPVILFFHAMGVTGESSGRIAEYLQNEYFCIMPTSTVYCEGQKYVSKADELRQIEEFLKENDVNNLALVVASSMPAKNNPNLGLAACF